MFHRNQSICVARIATGQMKLTGIYIYICMCVCVCVCILMQTEGVLGKP